MKNSDFFNLKLKYTLCTSVLFVLLYKAAEFYTKTLKNVPSIVMPWEKNIPFLPLFIIPYMTSAFTFFVVAFFIIKNKDSLVLLIKRANFLTIVSVIIFFIYPLKFSFVKPVVQNPIYNFLFFLLHIFDSSFNQCPSLHVSYAILCMITFYKQMNSKFKYLFCFWCFLVAISVLFVYQHHFIDVIGGFIITIVSYLIFPEKNNK